MSAPSPWTGVYTDWTALEHGSEPIRLLVATDGLYDIRTTPIGTFRVKRPDLAPTRCTEGMTLAIPHMPWSLLDSVITRFRAALPDECLANVYWDADRTGFTVVYPPQDADRAQVTTDDTTDPYDPRCPRVLQIHSHGTFPARFSATDDADEQATGCYGVLGFLDQPIPLMAFRFACGGRHVPLSPDDLFA